jgi:AraC-like DNA-binding protein
VRTSSGTYSAQSGDTILLPPGVFAIEATPAVEHGIVNIEIARFSLAALGRGLSNGSTVEALLLGVSAAENTGVYVQRRMLNMLDRELAAAPMFFKDVEALAVRILNSLKASTFQFLRFAFFEKRWAFLSMLEAHVLRSGVVEWLAANYVDGRAAFFRDCKIFVGMSPAKWVKTRRLELARAWLQHGKANIEDIARVLGYCNIRAFRTALWKHFAMSIRELSDAEEMRLLENRHDAFRPFWWPAPLPLIGEAQSPVPPADEFPHADDSSPEPDEKSPAHDASGSPPENECGARPKPVEELFYNLEAIPVSEIVPFPARLPELLKAA